MGTNRMTHFDFWALRDSHRYPRQLGVFAGPECSLETGRSHWGGLCLLTLSSGGEGLASFTDGYLFPSINLSEPSCGRIFSFCWQFSFYWLLVQALSVAESLGIRLGRNQLTAFSPAYLLLFSQTWLHLYRLPASPTQQSSEICVGATSLFYHAIWGPLNQYCGSDVCCLA